MQNEEYLISQLAELINEHWRFHEENPIYNAKESMLAFVEQCDNLEIIPQNLEALECLKQIRLMVERVLEVDMRKSSNRKGSLPQALGLVSRKSDEASLRDIAVFYAYDHARYNLGEAGRAHEECAYLVARALERTKSIKIDQDNIQKIYQRILANEDI